MVECYYMCQSDNGSITDTHALRQWSNSYMRSIEGVKDPRAPLRLSAIFAAVGLVEIDSKMIPIPLCEWSNGKILAQVSYVHEAPAPVISCASTSLIQRLRQILDKIGLGSQIAAT